MSTPDYPADDGDRDGPARTPALPGAPVGPQAPADGSAYGVIDPAAAVAPPSAPGAPGGEPVEEPTDGLEWHRMHPVTPAIKSWKAFVAILAIVAWQFVEFGESREFVTGGGWRVVLLAIVGVVAVATVYSLLAWRFTRYAIGAEAVHLRTGILFRQQRQARLDRLQAVDVVRPLLARLAGLSELRLEVAGAGDAQVALAFLREEEAMAVRAELLARAAGLDPVEGAGPVDEAPEQQVIEVPVGRLFGSIALSGVAIGMAVGLVLAVGAGVLTVVFGDGEGFRRAAFGQAFLLIPAVIGVVGVFWSRFSQGFNFRAAISSDGIRLAHGLLEVRSQTVAPGRIQAISMTQPLMWRLTGWWRVQMNVAGYGVVAQAGENVSALLPVGTSDDALVAVWLVLPDLGTDEPRELLSTAMTGSGPEGGFTLAARRSRWVDPLSFRRNGYHITDRALIARTGRLRRSVVVVPHERTQSIGVVQGPIQRALGVASFTMHSVPGPVTPVVPHLGSDAAHALLEDQAERARLARGQDAPEQWMRAQGEH